MREYIVIDQTDNIVAESLISTAIDEPIVAVNLLDLIPYKNV